MHEGLFFYKLAPGDRMLILEPGLIPLSEGSLNTAKMLRSDDGAIIN